MGCDYSSLPKLKQWFYETATEVREWTRYGSLMLLCCYIPSQTIEQTVDLSVIWDGMMPMWRKMWCKRHTIANYLNNCIHSFNYNWELECGTWYHHPRWHHGLAPTRRQIIIWTNDGIVYWNIYASLGPNVLTFQHNVHICLHALSFKEPPFRICAAYYLWGFQRRIRHSQSYRLGRWRTA